MVGKRKIYKVKTGKIKKFLGKLVLTIAKHLFLDCLIIFLLALIIGGFFYYKYNILIQGAELESFEKPFLSEKNDYQEVISFWQENEEKFEGADLKKYINPFKEPSIISEEVPENESQ